MVAAEPDQDGLMSNALYRLLASLGFPRPEIGTPGLPSVAWPQTKIAVAFPGDPIPDDWHVVQLDAVELNLIASVLSRLVTLLITHSVTASAQGARRRTSKAEDQLCAEMLKIGLPQPDRNFIVHDDNDRNRGVLDFAWESIEGVSVKVAVELDGWWHHVGRDLADEIDRWAAFDPKVKRHLNSAVRVRGAADAAKRRLIQGRGWQVVVVHDTELNERGGYVRCADEIRRIIAQRFLERAQRPLFVGRTELLDEEATAAAPALAVVGAAPVTELAGANTDDVDAPLLFVDPALAEPTAGELATGVSVLANNVEEA